MLEYGFPVTCIFQYKERIADSTQWKLSGKPIGKICFTITHGVWRFFSQVIIFIRLPMITWLFIHPSKILWLFIKELFFHWKALLKLYVSLVVTILEYYVLHYVKSAQIRIFFWSVFSPIRAEYGPEKAPYLDLFHAVLVEWYW